MDEVMTMKKDEEEKIVDPLYYLLGIDAKLGIVQKIAEEYWLDPPKKADIDELITDMQGVALIIKECRKTIDELTGVLPSTLPS